MNQKPSTHSTLLAPKWRRQAIANSVTHGFGALLAVAALVLLVLAAVRQGSPKGVFCAAVFGASMVCLYVSSTLLHSLPPGRARRAFVHLDLACIFGLIAGTYTPFTLLVLRGALGWSLFGIVWVLAILGIILASAFQKQFERVAAYLYLALGWLIVIAIHPLARELGTAGMVLLVGGGLAYSVGVIFFLRHRFLYYHSIWHVFVLLGSFLHFLAVLLYVLPDIGRFSN
jgi:hemolysin III